MSTAAPLAVDASVVAKVFLQEADSPAARTLIGAPRLLVGPELIAVEVASAVIRRFRTGGLSRAEAEASLSKVRALFLSGSMTLTPDADLQPRAEAIALDLKHALQDCLYVAAAEKAGAELVTADPVLLKRAAPHFPFVRAL